MTNIKVNGEEFILRENATLADLIEEVTGSPTAPGVAAAVNEEVVPKNRWSQTRISPEACIELVRAVQGG